MDNALPSWNLATLYPSPDAPELEAAILGIVPAAREFESRWRGRIAQLTPGEFAQLLEHYESVSRAPLRPYAYAHLRFAQNSLDPANVALMERVRRQANDAHRATIFFNIEPDEMDDATYASLVADPAVAPWAHFLAESRRAKKFRLSEKEESVVAMKSLTGKSAFVQLYSRLTSAMRFPSPLEEGKTLTNAEILALSKHPDRAVRRKAMENFANEYEKAKLVITSVWNALALDHRQESELRGYTHPMEPTNLGNELSQKAVDTLMEVTRRNYHLAGRYYRWKAGVLGVDKLWTTDLSAPLPGGEPEKVSFEQAMAWVFEAFGDFSPEFERIARGFLEEGRIDAEPREGKSGGAFCMAVSPDLPVYVLTNHTGKLRDAATLAHELGHGIHFSLSRVQPLLEYGAVLPLAETASVFGELLLTKKLLAGDLSPEERRGLLAERVEDMIATTFRQAMYTDFELEAHLRIGDAPLSEDQFCDLWKKNLTALYGESVEILDGSKWGWSAIPHFIHTRFYCYAYTFGELLVLALYKRYQEEGEAFVPKLMEILRAGGSRTPAQLVALIGCDLEDPAFWQGGYDVLGELITELGG